MDRDYLGHVVTEGLGLSGFRQGSSGQSHQGSVYLTFSLRFIPQLAHFAKTLNFLHFFIYSTQITQR